MSQSEETHFGFKTVPVAEKAGRVAGVFRSVAARYDVLNDLMSLGSHRLMKRVAVELTCARAGDSIMDLAGGTGDLAARLAPLVGPAGQVVLVDINESMLAIGRQRLHDKGIVSMVSFVQGDAEDLPFPDDHFNAVTMAFGLRNVTHQDKALSSILRVLKPGGRFLFYEHVVSSHKRIRTWQGLLNPIWKFATTGCNLNRDLSGEIERAGFSSVEFRRFSLSVGLPVTIPNIVGFATV